jgi:hypothetical protein
MEEDKVKQTAIVFLHPKRCKTCVVNDDKVDDKIMELKLSDCKIMEVLDYDLYMAELEGCKRGYLTT